MLYEVITYRASISLRHYRPGRKPRFIRRRDPAGEIRQKSADLPGRTGRRRPLVVFFTAPKPDP